MNLEKVSFAFFILLALTLNFGFFIGEFSDPNHHNAYELFAAIVVNIIATVMKIGDRTQIGNVLLASSFVADLHFLAAAVVWWFALYGGGGGTLSPETTASIVSLSGGALLANIISVVILTAETIVQRR